MKSSAKVDIHSSAFHFFHPSMNFCSVAAWISREAGILGVELDGVYSDVDYIYEYTAGQIEADAGNFQDYEKEGQS